MNVGILVVDINIPLNNSLKGKRMILQGLKRKIRAKFNVSVSETDHHDLWQRATLSYAAIGNSKRLINSTLSCVKNFILKEAKIEVLNYQIEII